MTKNKNRAASRIVSGSYDELRTAAAAREMLAEVGGTVSCAIVFVSADYLPQIADFLEVIRLHGHVPLLLGCTGSGLVGTGVEEEMKPGFTLLFLHLSRTDLQIFRLSQQEVEECRRPEYWRAKTRLPGGHADGWIALTNPFIFATEQWLPQWNLAYPGETCIGGLASGGASGDEAAIFLNGERIAEGALVLALKGGVRIEPVISQGCRPIGTPFTITGADRNYLLSIGSTPAYEVLQAAYESLDETEKEAAQGNIFAGIARTEYVDDFQRGDFLVRNILGADPKTGAVAISAMPRVGQTLQYQLRDARTAHEDYERLCAKSRDAGQTPFATLLFTCTGRGTGLFNQPNHDAGVLKEHFGETPSAGLFCNGEIGPIGEVNFVHGYSACTALLLDR